MDIPTDRFVITEIAQLEAIYGAANPKSLTKVAKRLTPLYRKWIGSARFAILSTIGPEGTDASPRGDEGPVVQIADDATLLMPDWRGNNRLDSLRNIVRDPRASLMFLAAGCDNVVRVNGTAHLTRDPAMLGRFERGGKQPRTVIVLQIGEVYFQCAKALMRSRLWSSTEESAELPTAGQFLKEMQAEFDAETYDAEYAANAAPRMW